MGTIAALLKEGLSRLLPRSRLQARKPGDRGGAPEEREGPRHLSVGPHERPRPRRVPWDLRKEAIPRADEKIAEEPGRVSGHWKGLEHFPDEETFMHLRGRAYKETGDPHRAIRCFNRAIGMKPSFAGARVELAKLHEARGSFDLGEETFREIGTANPGYAGGPVSLAMFLGRRGRWEEAERTFRAAWPKLAPWEQERLKKNPDAKALLDRVGE